MLQSAKRGAQIVIIAVWQIGVTECTNASFRFYAVILPVACGCIRILRATLETPETSKVLSQSRKYIIVKVACKPGAEYLIRE